MADLQKERLSLLQNINELTNKPLYYLSFLWIGIIAFELTVGVSPFFEYLSFAIWIIFIIDFLMELIIAPRRLHYIRENWINALSLVLPALRIFRIFRVAKLLKASKSLRSLNLLKIIASLNHGVMTLRSAAQSYGIKYILPLTGIIMLVGAAGMMFFEGPHSSVSAPDRGINNYGDAVWYTAMLMTTMGSEYWPHTIEGRILTFIISVYSIAIFGYVTATLASFLIERKK